MPYVQRVVSRRRPATDEMQIENSWIIVGAAAVLVVLALWPRRGLIARWRSGRVNAARVLREDALKHVLKSEANGEAPTLVSVAGTLQIRQRRAAELLADMEARGLVAFEKGGLRLSESGRELALHIIRAHRLWESYLADQTGVAEAEWHLRAERQEHLLTPEQATALAAALGNPARDPHGDAIPDDSGRLPGEIGQPLSAVAVNTPVVITHVEDEPPTIYAQITAAGLRPGMRVCVLEKASHRIRFWADGREHVLAPILAANLSVASLPDTKPADLFEEAFLSSVKAGERACVAGLSAACRGAERRRLLDLGFVPGTEVAVEMVSPGGDPTAYRVRGTVVALRREQAGLIRISGTRQATA